MAELWLIEFAKGFGRFFLNPVLYFALILAVTAGILRVKRERKDFNTRVHDLVYELKHLLPAGLLAGLIVSIATISTGFVISPAMVIMVAAVTILLGLAGNSRLLSPAFTVGLALLFVYAIDRFKVSIPYFSETFANLDGKLFIGAAVLIGVLIITEGFLMLKNGLKDVSPKLRKSRRGLTVGAHQTKRLWLLPIFCFLPTGPLGAPFEWWPVVEWGSQTYSLILIPFAIGFQQQIQRTLPKEVVGYLANQVIILGFFITAIAIAGFWLPVYVPLAAAGAAIIGRLWISHRHRMLEDTTPYYFTPRNSGIMILDVIPNSPAEKMGLKTGEIIQSCNNMIVRSKQDLYNSLLQNRAYCKLEVLDTNGEIRLLQRALYEDDHHELGILFIEKRSGRKTDEAV